MSATRAEPTVEREKPDPRKQFLKLAPKRVQNVLKDLDTLMICTDKPAYEYTDDQAEKIINAVRAKVEALEDAFANGGRPAKRAEFSLD